MNQLFPNCLLYCRSLKPVLVRKWALDRIRHHQKIQHSNEEGINNSEGADNPLSFLVNEMICRMVHREVEVFDDETTIEKKV